jgi:hypothetical protein
VEKACRRQKHCHGVRAPIGGAVVYLAWEARHGIAEDTHRKRNSRRTLGRTGTTAAAAARSLGQLQLSETVAMHLRERIISGEIAQGEFLRSMPWRPRWE